MTAAPREDIHLLPHQIIMRTVPCLPADLHCPHKPLRDMPPPPSYLEQLQINLNKYHDLMRSPPDDPALWTAPDPFQLGEAIPVAVSPIHYRHKFAPKWEGPFQVIRVPNRFQVVYDYRGQERTANVNDVK